jgi:hypothetical protein
LENPEIGSGSDNDTGVAMFLVTRWWNRPFPRVTDGLDMVTVGIEQRHERLRAESLV